MGSHQEYVPHHPKPEVVYDLPLNLQGLESAFAHCVEFASREIVLVQGGTCTVCWLDGLVKSERLNDYVLRTCPLRKNAAWKGRRMRRRPRGHGTPL